MEQIFDGIQRPLKTIAKLAGDVFIPRGVDVHALDGSRVFEFNPTKIKVCQLISSLPSATRCLTRDKPVGFESGTVLQQEVQCLSIHTCGQETGMTAGGLAWRAAHGDKSRAVRLLRTVSSGSAGAQSTVSERGRAGRRPGDDGRHLRDSAPRTASWSTR